MKIRHCPFLCFFMFWFIISNQVYSQSIGEFKDEPIYCEVKFVVFGEPVEQTIMYTKEGLLMNCFPGNGKFLYQFVFQNQINKEKEAQLQHFLQDSDFFSYCESYDPGRIVLDGTSFIIVLRQGNLFKVIHYSDCYHSNLATLIQLISQLIPERFQEDYAIKYFGYEPSTCICNDTIQKN